MNKQSPITNEIFSDFLHCERKCYLKIFGESGEKSEYELIQKEHSDYYKNKTIKYLSGKYTGRIVNNPVSLNDILREQYSLVIDVSLFYKRWNIHLDALARAQKTLSLKRPEYIPILFFHEHKINRSHKLILSFCGLILGETQKRLPQYGLIIYRRTFATARIKLGPMFYGVKKIIKEIASFTPDNPPKLMLNSHCLVCEFWNRCHNEAIQKDDLSLFRGLSRKKIAKLNKRGIFKVTQYSYTFLPRRKKVIRHPRKHDYSLQALAIRTNKIHVFERPYIPSSSDKLYLDIESDPDTNFYYLIGCLACIRNETQLFQFWADSKSDESNNWNELLRIINGLEDFTIYHYGSFESKHIKQMESLFGDSPISRKLKENTFNILSAIHGHSRYIGKLDNIEYRTQHRINPYIHKMPDPVEADE